MRHRRMPARTLDGQDKNIRPGHGGPDMSKSLPRL